MTAPRSVRLALLARTEIALLDVRHQSRLARWGSGLRPRSRAVCYDASGRRLGRLTTMASWLLRAMTTTASSAPGFSSRCGTYGGTKM